MYVVHPHTQPGLDSMLTTTRNPAGIGIDPLAVQYPGPMDPVAEMLSFIRTARPSRKLTIWDARQERLIVTSIGVVPIPHTLAGLAGDTATLAVGAKEEGINLRSNKLVDPGVNAGSVHLFFGMPTKEMRIVIVKGNSSLTGDSLGIPTDNSLAKL